MPKTKVKKTIKKPVKKKLKKIKKVKKIVPEKVEVKEKLIVKPEKYWESEGRRKTAVARIRLFIQRAGEEVEKMFLVNERPLEKYFSTSELQEICKDALEKMKCLDKFRISAMVKGGGLHAQAEAIRHGIAKTLVLFNPDFRKRLKKAGYLTRDARIKERKKFGLKRARRAPQWQKR